MDLSQKSLQHIVFPQGSSQQFVSYTFELLTACGGFPGDMHFGRGVQEFTAVFFSQNSQGKFNIEYGKALQGNFSVTIWEKANGPIISEERRICLLEFHKFLKAITPVITFLEENGGWPTPTEFNGFKPLEDALHNNTLPSEIKESSDEFLNSMAAFFFVCDALTKYPTADSLPKNNIDISFKRNILHMYIDFSKIYAEMLPLIHFIESHGGWPKSAGEDFPGFAALKSSCSSGNLQQEVIASLEAIEGFMKIFLIGKNFITSQNPTIQITPHNKV